MKTILLVEDEEIILLNLTMMIQKFGYNVVSSVKEDEIKNYLTENVISLAIVDIGLAEAKNGIELVNDIFLPNKIPVMYLTSYDQDDMIEKIGQTKPHSYMLKPFTEKELKLNISIILYRSEIEQKLRYKDRWITSIINNISDAILVVDLYGKLLFMNKITKDICYLETEKKDIVLHNIIDFFDDELNPFDREFVNHSIKNKAAIMYDHMIIKVLGNDQYQTDCFVSPLILEENRVEGAVITLKNLKKVEPQLVQ